MAALGIEVPRNRLAVVGNLDDRLTIACGTGAVRLTQVQREGKSAMDAEAFLRGTGSLAGVVAR